MANDVGACARAEFSVATTKVAAPCVIEPAPAGVPASSRVAIDYQTGGSGVAGDGCCGGGVLSIGAGGGMGRPRFAADRRLAESL